MDDQRKNHNDPERPPQENRPEQQQIHNVPARDVENTNGSNKGGDLLLVNKPRTLHRGTERMPQVDQRDRRTTVHWLTHPQRGQDEAEKTSCCVNWQQKGIWYGPAWLNNKLSQNVKDIKVINFIGKTMENWRVEVTTGGKSIAKAKRGILQGDALSPLQIVIVMTPLNHILWKCTQGYKLSKSQHPSHHYNARLECSHFVHGNIKPFAKNKKLLETLIVNENTQWRHGA